MPSNTTYDPQNNEQFSKSKLSTSWIGVSGTANYGTTTNIDYTLVDDLLITGLMIIAKNQLFGDTVTMQVLFPNGSIANTFGNSCYIPDDSQKVIDVDSKYPAKIPAGFILRLIYTSTSLNTNVDVKINYKLHKVLI